MLLTLAVSDWLGIGQLAMAVTLTAFTAVYVVLTWRISKANQATVEEMRRAREAEVHERTAAALRAALVEQLENCRYWGRRDPSFGTPAVEALRGWQPSFEKVTTLLGGVALAPELTAYLLWAGAIVRDEVQREAAPWIDEYLGLGPNAALGASSSPGALYNVWSVVLERLQVITSLILAEAARQGFTDVTAGFPAASLWLTPLVWPETFRVNGEQGDRVMRGAPLFPSGPAFEGAAPASRQAQALRMQAHP